jgi:hypothetical protein
VAGFHSEAAVGLTAVHRFKSKPNVFVNVGASLGGGDEWLYRVGGSYEF